MYSLIHTCIKVSDLEKSLKFYSDALGLKQLERKDFPQNKYSVAYLSDKSESIEIKLFYDYNQEKSSHLMTEFTNLGFTVPDLKKSHLFHKENGYNPSSIDTSEDEPFYYCINDPNGYKIKILRD